MLGDKGDGQSNWTHLFFIVPIFHCSDDFLNEFIAEVELYGIPMIRFKTNGSGEKEILISKLEELVR